jgi:putative FmdB family regulatory protein
MPLYEYECDACGQRFELIRKFSDPPLEVCAVCGKGPVRRLPSSPAIQFKGSGWYITDYAQKGKSEKPAGEKPADSKTDAAPAAESASKTDGTPAKSDGAANPTTSTAKTSESKS